MRRAERVIYLSARTGWPPSEVKALTLAEVKATEEMLNHRDRHRQIMRSRRG